MGTKRVTNRQKTRYLGDLIESALATIGVNEEKYKEFKAKFGLLPVCSCSDRKKWLNQFSKEFGESPTKAVRRLFKRASKSSAD